MRILLTMFVLSPLAAQGLGLKLQNGVDTHIDVPYHPTVVPQSGVTVEAWVTYDDSTIGPGLRWPTIVRQNTVPGVSAFFLRVAAGSSQSRTLHWAVYAARGTADVYWPFAAGQLLTWTHVAGTWDGANARLFINGAQVASATAGGPIVDNGGVLRIGNGDLSIPGGETWNGEIDEVRLWPVARTAAEILETLSLETALIPGEASTWNLNGNAKDSSGGNSGAIQGAVRFSPNLLRLLPYATSGALPFGGPTPGCAGTPAAGLTCLPLVGNGAFAVSCIRTTTASTGILWLALGRLTTPLRVAGADIWVDPLTPGLGVPSQVLLHEARVSLPIPNNPWLVGQVIYVQMFFGDPACAVPLIASAGMGLGILP